MSIETDMKPVLIGEALDLINGPRQDDYGVAKANFARVANFWQAYFLNTGRRINVRTEDIAPMMRLLKEARLCGNPTHRDSFVDLIGYTVLGAEINTAETEQER